MPSPFPGMDPYLELAHVWRDFHSSLIAYCRDALNQQLPDNYVARIEERFVLREAPEEAGRLVVPDVGIVRDAPAPARPRADVPAVATLEPVTVPVRIEMEERETWIEIRDHDEGALITAIELLSPSNKAEPTHSEYISKRRALFRRRVNLVELDLLLSGHRLPMAVPLPAGDYYAFVIRAVRFPRSDVYDWSIRQPLPVLPIPLKAPDPDVSLDLAGLFARAYEGGRYGRLNAYRSPLTLPLKPEDRAWSEELARAAAR